MARFLTDNDYKKQIQSWIKNVIQQNDSLILEDAELAAQAEMESFLNARYDVSAIFSTTQPTADRNRLIILYLVDITLYHLFTNISPDMIPELREKRYKAAIQWCKDVATGKASPLLPENDTTAVDAAKAFSHGGNEKYHSPDSRY